MAPPPATTDGVRIARRTTMMASCSERSASSMNCCAPPRRTMVAVVVNGHPVKKLYRSSPTWRSSKRSQVPRTAGLTPASEVWILAPVARATRSRSSLTTRPAQKSWRSAKYCVARSPMAKRERMTCAPVATMASSLSVMILNSASTMRSYSATSAMRISALSFSALSSSSMLRRSTFALSNALGCCSKPAYENVFLNATPLTSIVSSSAAPGTFLIASMLMSRLSSRTSTASTTIREKNSRCWWMSFDCIDVAAHCSSRCRRSALGLASTETLISLMRVMQSCAARRNARMMTCGCTPSSINGRAARRNAPARTTTDVVPSPTSSSCDLAMSTIVLAAGCTMSRRFMMVAPSLEIVT
eukprot:Amastigsp_a175365_241.p3 type:complete len:358 gc:universal Amastigsp_a175365_241:413-1486(+)